jgi:hypothetical protein
VLSGLRMPGFCDYHVRMIGQSIQPSMSISMHQHLFTARSNLFGAVEQCGEECSSG